MSKILVIGVGGAGRETVKHMKDIGTQKPTILHLANLKMMMMKERIFHITI